MIKKNTILIFIPLILLILLAGFTTPADKLFDITPTIESHNATADELIYFTNLRRTQYGLSALTVNSILMTSAQQTAETMAGYQSGSHLGGASQNISEMGYGNGVTVYSTENVANGTDLSAEYIVYTMWNDDLHNIPVMNPIYCDIGAGVATDSEGTSYYVLRAAYNEKRYCGEYRAPDGTTLETLFARTTTTDEGDELSLAEQQWMQPVSRSTPNAEGQIIHVVDYGQTLWTIAITYNTTIKEIQALNSYSEDDLTVYPGQKLHIPSSLSPYPTDIPVVTDTPAPVQTAEAVLAPAISTQPVSTTILPSPQTEQTGEKQRQNFLSSLFWIGGIGLLLILLGIGLKFFPNQYR